MKGRCATRRCPSELKLKTRKNEKEVCGLGSVPDDVLFDCLARVSRLDLVALATVSKSHRSFAVSHHLRDMRYRRGSTDPYLYVYMQMYPDPCPQWFVLHPVQRRLKPVSLGLYPVPAEGSCVVKTDWEILIIGGLSNGKPTSEVWSFCCVEHKLYQVMPMKMARSGASACLIGDKIYVFGGCSDDSSNWVEVLDIETGTWDLLSVFSPKMPRKIQPPKMPLKIQQSVAMDEKHVYTVNEDGKIFVYITTECRFVAERITEPNPENRKDWLLVEDTFFCRGTGGKILWRMPRESRWKEVKGLEELQQQHSGLDIIKLCRHSVERLAIFWESRPQAPDQVLELCYAEFSLSCRYEGEAREVSANVEWSGVVLSGSAYSGLNLLYAGSLYF